jgi:hypothetical protein
MPEVPKVLYKYLKPCAAEIFLSRPQLRFTKFTNLDDVLEVLPGQRPRTENELSKTALADSEKTGQSIEECRTRIIAHDSSMWWGRGVREAFKNRPGALCISCLTEHWESDSMWARYADFHRGVVFGVHTADLAAPANNWGQVKYRKKRPLLPTEEAAFNKVNRGKVLLKAALSKSKEWKYQKEWRAVAATEEIVFLEPSAVAEIYVGYEAAPAIVKQALDFKTQSPTTQIYQAFPHPQKYVMERSEL